MKATELLKAQHRDVEKLFKQIEKSEDENEKGELFEELAASLVAHDAIEREIFYPACEEKMGMTDLLGEALVEHGLVEFTLYSADQALGEADFDYKCTVLKEVIEHHVKEEEDSFFPKVEKAFDGNLLKELAVAMEVRFEKAKREDFRGPLFENLRQVLEGAMKTTPKKRPAAKRAAQNGSKSPTAEHSNR